MGRVRIRGKVVGMMIKASSRVYQFKVTLKGIRPPIWRRIQVPDNYTFWDLHVAIQDAMGWMDCHLHEFTVPDPRGGAPVRIGVPDPEYGFHAVLPEEKQRISDWFFVEGKPAVYTYDFGDDWEHTVKLEKILPREEGEDYPRCVRGKRACPPEDCGGPWGYLQLLEVLADPGHEEYEEMLEWLGEDYEPEWFHPEEVVFLNPEKLRKHMQVDGGGLAARAVGAGAGEEPAGRPGEAGAGEAGDYDNPHEDPCARDLLERIRSGEAPLARFKGELDTLMPDSILAAAAAVDAALAGYEKGEITPEEAEEVIRNQADLHPLHPFLFEMCAAFALPRMDELEVYGYMALSALKSERLLELTGEDFIEDMQPDAPQGFRELVQKVGESCGLLQARAYVEKGGDHLVNHFLVEDILGSHWEVDEELLGLALERSEHVIPIAVAMCGDLLEEVDADLLPYGFVYLLRLIGCLRPREALPVLLRALEECSGEDLHEAVLALAKLGSLYPGEVSAGLRGVAGDPDCGETRLAAVEALGLLGKQAGNFDFLRETLRGLDAEDPDYNDMFLFLVQALASSGHEEAAGAIGAALEKHGPSIPEDAAAFAREFLADPGFIGLGCRLEDFVDEDMADLRVLELDPDVDLRRSTMTRDREEAFESVPEEDEEWMPDLDWVEEQLRTGRNEPCPCGSGLKFKKCCLPRLEELRDGLVSGAFEEAEPRPLDQLVSLLEDFARQPSMETEIKAAQVEFLDSLGRSRFGESGIGGAELLEEAVFLEWFLLARPLSKSGKTVVEEFEAARGPGLDGEKAGILRGLKSSRFSIFEIESIGADSSVSLRDVFRNERFEVYDEVLGPDTAEGDLLAGFLGDAGGRYSLLGNVIYAPGDFLEDLERFAREESGRSIERGEAADLDEFLNRSGYRVVIEVMRLYEYYE